MTTGPPDPTSPSPGSRPSRWRGLLGLAALLLVTGGLAVGAMLRSSTTFDEIVLVAAGARAVETGSWSLVVDQPPVMPFLYGAPFQLVGAEYPSEIRERMLRYDDRWEYARSFFFRVGNDPERLALVARLVALAAALGLVAATWAYGAWIGGALTAAFSAALVAFHPDVLAHAGVAYNDVPLALAYLLAVWALDSAVRRPGVVHGAVAGLAVALALGVKFSALALGPVALLLVALEAVARDRARRAGWGRSVALAGVAAVVAGYVALALMYRGDWYLIGLEHGLRFTVAHASEGHPAPAWLFGETSPTGWWYFFPVALAVKTPAALALLAPLAAVGAWLAGRSGRRGMQPGGRVRALLASRARGPVVGAAVFAAFLLAASLNVGTRYALPALPPLFLLVGLGLGRLWTVTGPRRRAGVALLVLLYAGSAPSVFPWFLSYRSEWVRAWPAGEEALLDSSYDWGQGLLALRGWMEAEGVASVRLSYFGSALPAGYGIRYERLPSFLRLPPEGARPAPGAAGAAAGEVSWTAISATNLHGLYLEGDPFAAYREREPDRVVGGSMYLYREGGG